MCPPQFATPTPDFRALFESAPGCYLVLTPELVIVAVSDGYLKATMTRREDLLGRPLFEAFPANPDDPGADGVANLRASLQRVLAERRADTMAVQKYDIRRPEAEGGAFEERHWSPVNSPVLDGQGALRYIIHRVEDVTDFVRVKQQSHADHQRAEQMEAEVYRRAQQIQEANQRLRALQVELEQRVRDRTVELETTNRKLVAEGEERARATEALRDSESRYRLLFLGNPHPMWVYDAETLRFLAVNEAACRAYGYSEDEFSRMTLGDIRPPEDVPQLLESLRRGRDDYHQPREWRHRRRDGSLLVAEVSSHVLTFDGREAVLVLATDITQRKLLEDQLRQSQKMEAIGRLAGGVAHDFNNLLTAILGHAQLLTMRHDLDPAMVHEIADIEKAATRAAALTRQLLAFSRQQVLQPKVLDLNGTILDMDTMLRRLIGEDVDLLTHAARDLGRVKADPGQIEQVLLNLVVNARDAMPDGGKLTIETGNVTLDENYVSGKEGLAPGAYVMIAVSDDGTGMDAEIRSRIFEPFFTTKEVGRGTGLGLSTVHGIVRQSGGHIEVYSEPGHGSTFKVYLPRVEAPLDLRPKGPPARGALGGSETILVIEDDQMVRDIVGRTLRLYGYAVLEASDRAQALRTFEAAERDGQPLDLVLSDVVMPGMSVRELGDRLRAIRPQARILYMSGYTDRAILHQGRLGPEAAFLQKPFTVESLLIKVRELLGEPQAPVE